MTQPSPFVRRDIVPISGAKRWTCLEENFAVARIAIKKLGINHNNAKLFQ